MTQISPTVPVPTGATPRRPLTPARKRRCHSLADGLCAICGRSVSLDGAEYDHFVPLELGGADDDANLRPLHRPCHLFKTLTDLKAIAKARRIRKRLAGERRTRKPIASPLKPWPAKGTRKLSGRPLPGARS